MLKKIRKSSQITKARHWIGYLFVFGFYRLSGCLPWKMLVVLGRFLGGIVFKLSSLSHPRAMINLETVFQDRFSPDELKKIAGESYRNLAVTVLEQGKSVHLGREEFFSLVEFSPEQVDLLQNLVNQGKGAIFASAHMGNWELLAQFGAWIGFNMSVLYKPPTNPYFNRFLYRLRGQNKLIDINSDLSRVVRRLRKGEVVSLLFDENARSRGIKLPFFGYAASTYRGPAYFALRAPSPIVCAYFVRLSSGKHRFLIDRVIQPDREGKLEEDIRRIMLEMNESLERVILQYPGQWNWPYRRWGRHPVPMAAPPRSE